MENVKKETVLYNRQKHGVEVTAIQYVQEQEVQPATEQKDAVHKDVQIYEIVATVDGEIHTRESGESYRETIARARKMFKEIYNERNAQDETVTETE